VRARWRDARREVARAHVPRCAVPGRRVEERQPTRLRKRTQHRRVMFTGMVAASFSIIVMVRDSAEFAQRKGAYERKGVRR